MHFRWATHGKINVTNCHPFPVQKRISSKASLKTNLGVAHNGVIPGAVKSQYSDTLQFVTSALVDIRQHIDKAWFPNFISQATHSKFALMRANGPVILIGEYIEDGGIFYSNDSYKPWLSLLPDDIPGAADPLVMGFCWECGIPTDDELCDTCEELLEYYYQEDRELTGLVSKD